MLGNRRITTEPLKSARDDDDDDDNEEGENERSGFWPFVALFRARETSELRVFGGPDQESPSLSSSFVSEVDERSTSVASVESSSRKLRFKEQVDVCLIPKREEYSKRIRVHLWYSPEEMAAAAHRNTIEFAAEGWDPMNCMEEENMYRCLTTNELIHPVHIEQNVSSLTPL